MQSQCRHCRDHTLDAAARFCPACGWPALRGQLRIENVEVVPGGRSVSALRLLEDVTPSGDPLGLDAVVRSGDQLLDRVAMEALAEAQGRPVILAGLTSIADGHHDAVSVALEHPMAKHRTMPIYRTAGGTTDEPRLKVLGGLFLDAFIADGDERRAFVALRNEGGPIAIDAVELVVPRLEDEGVSASVPADRLVGGLLERGETAGLAVRLTNEALERLRENTALATGARLKIGDLEVPIRIVDDPRKAIKLHIRDKAVDDMPHAGAGLSGRRARIGAALENRSSEAFRVSRITIARRGQSPVELKEIPLAWRDPIAPGQIIASELRPWLTEGFAKPPSAKPLPPGYQIFEVEIHAVGANGGLENDPVDFHFEIREEAPLVGRICIDFGTTQTAAAASLSELEPPLPPRTLPIVVELGAVGLTSIQAARLAAVGGEVLTLSNRLNAGRFLETTLALNRNGDWTAGDDIPKGEDRSKDLLVFEGFKWLASEKPPGALLETDAAIVAAWDAGEPAVKARAKPARLLAVFLDQVRRLIEEHPDIAAVCSAEPKLAAKATCKVFATTPVEMGEAMMSAFFDGFRDARMPQMMFSGLKHVSPPIIESWPPVLMVTEGSGEALAPLTLNGAAINLGVTGDTPGVANLAVMDVGGGSADFSAFQLTVERQDQRLSRRLSRPRNFMSRIFVGGVFEALIAETLRDLLRKPKDWAPVGFFETVRWLQHSQGPLSLFVGRNIFFNDLYRSEDDVRRAIEANLKQGDQEEMLREMLAQAPPAKMAPIGRDAFPGLVAALERRFLADCLPDLTTQVMNLKSAMAADDQTATWIIISGRGSACPLAREMIDLLINRHFDGRAQQSFMPPPLSKSITSWGALRLIDHLESEDMLTLELPDAMDAFGVAVGYDSKNRVLTARMTRVTSSAKGGIGLALLRADKTTSRDKPQIIYSVGADDHVQPVREGKAAKAFDPDVPFDKQWVYVLKRPNRKPVFDVAVGESQDAVADMLLKGKS